MLAKLLKFNEAKFCFLYLQRYGQEGEDFVTCANRCIEDWINEKEDWEERDIMVAQCLPLGSDKKTYKIRRRGKESILRKVSLYLLLQVWPKFLNK